MKQYPKKSPVKEGKLDDMDTADPSRKGGAQQSNDVVEDPMGCAYSNEDYGPHTNPQVTEQDTRIVGVKRMDKATEGASIKKIGVRRNILETAE